LPATDQGTAVPSPSDQAAKIQLNIIADGGQIACQDNTRLFEGA
jgi:hypothetical protein